MEKQTTSSSIPASAQALNPASQQQTAVRIGFEEFIEAASRAVLRATEARAVVEPSQSHFPPIPIVIGIIYLPGLAGELGQAQLGATVRKEVAGQ